MAKPRVSLTMIVRNEAENLARALASVADLVDEVVVVDTGSTDATKEIAATFGARLFDFEWIDDFAAARNESLKHARGKWIFWLDADEWLDEVNRERLRVLFAKVSDEMAAYIMAQRSQTPGGSDGAVRFDQARLFPNDPAIRWRYRVHEQILPAVLARGGESGFTEIVIEHSGYQDPANYRRKQALYATLLERDQQEQPNDPFTLFNLGCSYSGANREDDAIRCWRKSVELSPPHASFRPKACALMAKAYRRQGKFSEAIAMCGVGRQSADGDVELLYEEGLARQAQGDTSAAAAVFEKLLDSGIEGGWRMGLHEGKHALRAREKLAGIYRNLGRKADAEKHWRAILAAMPAAKDAWLELGKLLLDERRDAEFAGLMDQMQTFPRLHVEAAMLSALRHARDGKAAEGIRLLQTLVRENSHAIEPRVLLSRLLLREEKWGAAEAVLKEVLSLAPGHYEARHNLALLRERTGVRASTVTDPIEIIRKRWPEVLSRSVDDPVFIFAAGWRSGSTLLQRMLMHQAFIWGEPYGRASPVDAMMRQLAPFQQDWPEEGAFAAGRASDQNQRASEWIANLYPGVQSLLDAHVAYFDAMFRKPAKAEGFARWGIKEVRLGAEHAEYLKWVFPRAKFLFLVRDPVACYRSYVALGRTFYRRWPDEPIDSVERFGEHWKTLAEGFLARAEQLNACLIRYEDLISPDFDPHEINERLGFALNSEVRERRVGGSPAGEHSPAAVAALWEAVEPVAGQFGYGCQ